MVDFANYLGNANLGLNTDASIPVVDTGNLNVINQTGRDIMLLNHENNIRRYDQKLKDRDKQLQLLDAGQIQTGEILDKDRPEVKKYQDAVDKEFDKFVAAGGINNKQAYRDYQGKIKELKDAVVHAQYRYLGAKTLEAEKDKQPLKYKQDLYSQHIAQEDSKGFWDGTYKPFQISLDYDQDKWIKPIQNGALVGGTTPISTSTKVTDKNGKVTTVQTTTPIKGQNTADIIYEKGIPYNVTTQHYDYGYMLQKALSGYSDPSGEITEQQNMHRANIENAPVSRKEPYLNHIVQRVKDYNKDRNLKKGDNGYIDVETLPQKLGLDENGKATGQPIQLSTPEFSALTALADINGSYTLSSKSLLKDLATLQQNDKKIAGDQAIKWADVKGKNALRAAQIEKIGKQIEGKTPEQVQEVFDKRYAGIAANAIGGNVGNKGETVAMVPYGKSEQIFTIDQEGKPKALIPIGATKVYNKYDKDGNPKKDAKVIGFTGGIGYKTEFYSKNPLLDGNGNDISSNIDPKIINEQYLKAKKSDPALSKEYFLYKLSQKGVLVRFIGEDGKSATMTEYGDAIRILNNKNTKKSQDEPMENDAELYEQEPNAPEDNRP